MKRFMALCLGATLLLTMTACDGTSNAGAGSNPDISCGLQPEPDDSEDFSIGGFVQDSMTGEVVQIVDGQCEIVNSDGIRYLIALTDCNGKPLTVPAVGDTITAYHNGMVATSLPAQILGVYSLEIGNTGNTIPEWGITLKAENASSVGMSLICTQSGGKPTGTLQYGSEFSVQRYVNGAWTDFPYIIDNAVFTTEAHEVKKGSETLDINWAWCYGSLPSGDYRLCKSYMDYRAPGDYENQKAYALFSVPEEPPLDDLGELRTKHPDLFDLDPMKGLWVYVCTMGGSNYRYTLLEGKNIGYTDMELLNAPFVSFEEMRLILSTYDAEDSAYSVYAYQHPVSSYLWVPGEEELNDIAKQLEIEGATMHYIQPRPEDIADPTMYQTAYIGYDDSGYLWEHCLNPDLLALSSVFYLPLYKMETYADLEQFMTDAGGHVNMDATYDEVQSFMQITAGMDTDFFEKYTLFVVGVYAGSGSLRYGIKDVQIEDDGLLITVEQLNHPECMTEDMAGWLLTVPVEKTKLEGVTRFAAHLDLCRQ